MIVPRSISKLSPPKQGLISAPNRREHLFLHHSVTQSTSDSYSDWRAVQKVAFQKGYKDISYTFGVHVSGTVLEGRSPAVEGAHTEGYNRAGHAIVLIGNFNQLQPTREMIEAVIWLRWKMVDMGLLTPTHSFRYHRQVSRTECPGMNVIEKFNQFSAYPPQGDDDVPKDKDVVSACKCWSEGCPGFFQLQYDGGVMSIGTHYGNHFLGSAFSDDLKPHYVPTRRFSAIENEPRSGYTFFGTDGSFWVRRPQ